MFSISYKGATKRGPPLGHKITQKGLSYKWCPVKGCKKVVTYLRSHLQYVHKMKKGAKLDMHVKVARNYKGKKEMREIIIYGSSDSDEQSICSASAEAHVDPSPVPSERSCTSDRMPNPNSISSPPNMPEEQGDENSNSDSDEDPNYDDLLQEEFFTTKHPKTNRHKWLVALYQYLNLPDAGRKKNRNRLQHASHVRSMLEFIDRTGTDITIFAKDNGNIVWTNWVDPKMDS